MPRRATDSEFLDLLEPQRGALFRIADAYASNREARDDLTQEIVLQLWRAFANYDRDRPFAAWMKRIALNVAISWVRRAYRQARVAPAGQAIFELAADPRPDHSDEMAQLRAAIARLGELERALLLLHLDDHPHDEIAGILGLSTTNVATRLHRIKQRLRQHWRDPDETAP